MDKPIYFSKIEFKNNFLQDCEGTMLLNLVEKELSYQLVKRHRKNEKILFSYGVKIKDDDLPELLQYCNALDFEPYRNCNVCFAAAVVYVKLCSLNIFLISRG